MQLENNLYIGVKGVAATRLPFFIYRYIAHAACRKDKEWQQKDCAISVRCEFRLGGVSVWWIEAIPEEGKKTLNFDDPVEAKSKRGSKSALLRHKARCPNTQIVSGIRKLAKYGASKKAPE